MWHQTNVGKHYGTRKLAQIFAQEGVQGHSYQKSETSLNYTDGYDLPDLYLPLLQEEAKGGAATDSSTPKVLSLKKTDSRNI